MKVLDERLLLAQSHLEAKLQVLLEDKDSLSLILSGNERQVFSQWYNFIQHSSESIGSLVLVLDQNREVVFSNLIIPIWPELGNKSTQTNELVLADGKKVPFRTSVSSNALVVDSKHQYYLAVAQVLDFANEFGRVQGNQILISLVLFFLSILFLEIILIQLLLVPLKKISEQIRAISPQSWGTFEHMTALPRELAQFTETFNELVTRLKTAFDQRNEFTEDLAHQLRTPLTILKMQIELLRAHPRSIEELEKAIDDQEEGLAQLSMIIDSLLLVSRYESLAQLPELVDFSLGTEVADLVELFEPLANDQGLLIRKSIDTQLMMRGNPHILAQAISNLMDNAVKYGAGGEYIDVQVYGIRNEIFFEISNYGPIIPPEHLDRIYERFFRSNREGTSIGFGLGLAIVKQIVILHQGRIETVSNEKVGTRFSMIFPVIS